MCGGWICPAGMWKCRNNSICISNEVECCEACIQSSSDELELCKDSMCKEGYWKCIDGSKCIKESEIMNGNIDCPDSSDENRKYHAEKNCSANQFKCNNGQCILTEFVCDRRYDNELHGCIDNSDEGTHCLNWECHHDFWKCTNNLQCIKAEFVCDGKSIRDGKQYGCQDGSDEHNILCNYCKEHEWSCYSGDQCVSKSEVCNGQAQCIDESDESKSVCLFWTCDPGKRKCKDGEKCLDILKVCDGHVDCTDGSDEMDCDLFACPNTRRKCADNLQCIDNSHVCDDVVHCKDGSDELCDATCLNPPINYKAVVKTCSENGTICFPMSRFCDGVADCPEGSDECGCHGFKTETCQIGDRKLCIYRKWLEDDGSRPIPCRNTNNFHTMKEKGDALDEVSGKQSYAC